MSKGRSRLEGEEGAEEVDLLGAVSPRDVGEASEGELVGPSLGIDGLPIGTLLDAGSPGAWPPVVEGRSVLQLPGLPRGVLREGKCYDLNTVVS